MELSTNQNTRPMKERVKRVGHNLARVVHFLPETPLASHGDHFVDHHARSAGDEELVPFEQLTFDEQGMLDFERVFDC